MTVSAKAQNLAIRPLITSMTIHSDFSRNSKHDGINSIDCIFTKKLPEFINLQKGL